MLEKAQLFGSLLMIRFDSVDIPDIASVALCTKHHVAPASTARGIAIDGNREACVVGVVSDFQVTVGRMKSEH